MGGRRSAKPILPELLRVGAQGPVPIGRAQRGFGRSGLGLGVEPQKPHARRAHQALLARPQHHIDAPRVHVKYVAAERGHAIHRQQSVMTGGVDRGADRPHIGFDRACGIDMGHQHGADGWVSAQGRLDLRRVGRGRAAKLQHLHIDPKPARGTGPAVAKDPGRQHERLVTARKQVGIGRLPRAMAVADIGSNLARSARHGAQVGPQPRHHRHQITGIDVGRGAHHRGQDSVGQDRRAGDSKIGTTVGQGHGHSPFGSGLVAGAGRVNQAARSTGAMATRGGGRSTPGGRQLGKGNRGEGNGRRVDRGRVKPGLGQSGQACPMPAKPLEGP